LAYHRASFGGRSPAPGSPLATAAVRAVQRQGSDFAKAILGDDRTEQNAQQAQIEQGRRVAQAATVLPVPNDGDAVGRTLRSLAGQTPVVDMSGAGPASTIATDLDRWKDAERGRQVMNDPCFEEALADASIRAAKAGRRPTAADFNEALAAVKAKRGPQPPRPPQPVTPLLAATTAKSTVSERFSVVPDRIGGR
jgi:hypothetical protein